MAALSACSWTAAFWARNWIVSARSESPLCSDGISPDSETFALNSSSPARNFNVGLPPQLGRSDARAFGHRRELGPRDLAIPHARPNAAVRASDHVFLAN